MATAICPIAAQPQARLPTAWSLADLREHLGGIPLERIRLFPSPGLATVEDAVSLDEHEDRLCELVDGVLVEKPMGTYESLLAGVLIHLLHSFLEQHPLGIVLAPDGMLRILPEKMRMPDVSFIRWERFPQGQLPAERVYEVAPDLAVEILSAGNTEREMQQKLEEYFSAGVRLVWYIDPPTRSARVYTGAQQVVSISERGVLTGNAVLPGLEIRLGELFSRLGGGRDG
jgi:Uma2 family endonuclease